MRLLSSRLLLAATVLLAAAGVSANASLDAAEAWPQTLLNIQAAESQGLITADEAALNRIYYVFDGSKVDSRFFVVNDSPLKCATSLFHDIFESEALGAGVKATLQSYIDAPFEGGDRVLFISPGGNFRVTYLTTGPNAVPLADGDADGTPDFVEWCAGYMDNSWNTEITTWGFIPPAMIAGLDYQISFEAMSGAYGYTSALGNGRTRITLHNTFLGFPANDDPESDQKGAAKVTCAHEFKHASQYGGSNWLEGGEWMELDATWSEELVYPLVNDYKWYINSSGSPLRNPEQSLDFVSQGGYEDAIWEHYMSGINTPQIIVDVWQWRADHNPVNMLLTYNTILLTYGSSLVDTWAKFTRWNYFTGTRTVAGYGYPDAAIFTACQTIANQASLPANPVTIPVNHMAARYGRHYNLSGLTDWPKVIINGVTPADFRPQACVKKTDNSLVFYEIPLDANNDGELILTEPFSLISEIGITLPNGSLSGDNKNITYDIEQAVNTHADEGIPGYGDMRLFPNYPNPFNPKTTVSFELVKDSAVTLLVHTPSGRIVRHLLDKAPYGAGTHELVFDGKDDQGHELPSGLYFAALDTGGISTQLVKMTLLK